MGKHKKKIKIAQITHNPAIQRNLGIHTHMYERFKKKPVLLDKKQLQYMAQRQCA